MSAAIHHRSPTDAPRVVITGFGAVTCLGTDAGSTWEAMREGRSGVSHYGTGPFAPISDKWPTTIAGEVKDLDLSSIMDSREAKRLDRYTQFGMLAAHEAVGQSGIDFSKVDPVRAGVVIGSGVGGIATIEEGHSTLLKKGPTRVSPFTVPRLMANATTGNVSIRYGLRGPASAHATACASSGHAIQDAMGYIRRGYCDVMLSGGAEAAITPVCVSAFSTMKALSTRNDDPTRASRPFDQDRDGFVLGEGAGILVLESEAHARARGATIYAELLGAANSSDAYHITAPHEQGLGAASSMRWALEDAGLNTSDIDYINAHGTSTPLGDRAEAEAVKGVFGDHARQSAGGKLLMSSTKSMHGHALGASGAVEMVACIHAVRDGVIAPTINLDSPDDGIDVDLVAHESRERPMKRVMNNTFGFGGHNVTLIVGRYEG